MAHDYNSLSGGSHGHGLESNQTSRHCLWKASRARTHPPSYQIFVLFRRGWKRHVNTLCLTQARARERGKERSEEGERGLECCLIYLTRVHVRACFVSRFLVPLFFLAHTLSYLCPCLSCPRLRARPLSLVPSIKQTCQRHEMRCRRSHIHTICAYLARLSMSEHVAR